MNTLELSKKLKYREGDQVRGITEPYPRSIYRVVKIDAEGVHLMWESLRGIVYDSTWKCAPAARLLKWETPKPANDWGDFEGAFDFRLATPQEVKRSREIRE